MANIHIQIDTRHISKNGTAPLRICISHANTEATHALGIALLPTQWNEEKKCAIGKGAEGINRKIEATLYEWRLASLEVATPRMTATKLKEAILKVLYPTDKPFNSFTDVFNQYIAKKQGRTKEIYQHTLDRLTQYDKKLTSCTMEDITPSYLDAFDTFLARTSPSPNARAIHMRNIRAVFNHAIDEGYTSYYPFRKYKINYVETAKRSLTVDELRQLWHFIPEKHAVKYVDVFKLIFLLIGINIIDLCSIEKVINGRIEYNRAKTKKLYSIKVEPEAMEILAKYTNKDGHIDILRTVASHHSLMQQTNRALRKLGEVKRVGLGGRKVFSPMFPNLTTYWARHTWATIAAELDIPNETIAAALGHSYGNRTTNIYINFNQKKVDEANRRVIDYVLHGMR